MNIVPDILSLIIAIGYFFGDMKESKKNDSIRGLYTYGLAKNFRESTSLKLDYIDGMTIAVNWQDLEPLQGTYDFSIVLAELEWAKKNRKKINVVLYAGSRSPQWIYTRGIPTLEWRRRLKEDQAQQEKAEHTVEKSPVFWNEQYLTWWKKLVSELSNQISKHPSLGYVVITGATPKDYTTGTIIRYDDDWASLINAGYTFEKHEAAWKDLIDHFSSQFSNNELVLALGPLRPGSSDLSLSRALVDYIIQKQHKKIHFISVNLNDTWFKTSSGSKDLRNLLKHAKENGHSFGYQLVYSVHRNNKFKSSEKLINSLENTLALGIDDGASWLEVWHDDVILPSKKVAGTPNNAFESILKSTWKTLHQY